MKNSFYQLEIIADPTAKGEAVTKTENVHRDFLMTSRRIALLKFEEHFKALQTGNLQKSLEEEGHSFVGNTSIDLNLYLIQEYEKGKENKKVLLQKVQSIPSENLDYDMNLLQAEQDSVNQLIKEGNFPHKYPVEHTHFYRQKIWKVNGDEIEVIEIIEYSFFNISEAYLGIYQFHQENQSDSTFSELFIVETMEQQQKEYLLTEGGQGIFGMGYLISKDAHWKFGFQSGVTGVFGNRRIPNIFPGKFDKMIYSWWMPETKLRHRKNPLR